VPITAKQVQRVVAALDDLFPMDAPRTQAPTQVLSMNDELERLIGYSRAEYVFSLPFDFFLFRAILVIH
jgi:hypothetical protein